MLAKKSTRLSALFALLLSVSNVFSAPQSSLSVEAGADDSDGRNYYLSGRYAFENGIRIRASSGESISLNSDNKELSSSSHSFGIQSDPMALINVSFDISNADQISTLNIDSTRLTFEINTFDWGLYITPEFRQISAQTTTNTTIDFNSDGSSIGIAYYGFDPFYLSFSRQSYDYSASLSTIISNIDSVNLPLGNDTLNQVFALEDQRTTIEIGYYFTKSSIAFNQSKGRSVVDQSISTANKIYFSYKLSNHWRMGLSGGTSKLDISSLTTKFATLSLSYRW